MKMVKLLEEKAKEFQPTTVERAAPRGAGGEELDSAPTRVADGTAGPRIDETRIRAFTALRPCL